MHGNNAKQLFLMVPDYIFIRIVTVHPRARFETLVLISTYRTCWCAGLNVFTHCNFLVKVFFGIMLQAVFLLRDRRRQKINVKVVMSVVGRGHALCSNRL